MYYEFIELNRLVSVLINPVHLRTENLTEDLFRQYALMCFNEVERIKKCFHQAVLKGGDETRVKAYIQQHQASLIRFADTIYLYLKSGDLQGLEHKDHVQFVITFYKEMYGDINGLLLYLEKNFSQYFDLDAKLTILCHQEFTREIKSNLKQIQKGLKRNHVDEELINITCQPFESLQNLSATITYHKRAYLQLLLHEIFGQAVNMAVGVSSETICNLLLGMNYNNPAFYNYFILQFKTGAKDIDNKNELILFYLLKRKLINQLPIRPLLAYIKDVPDIRDQLCSWLTEEIYFIEQQQLKTGTDKHPYLENSSPTPKIQTTLAVPQLSFAVKLLIDAGIIINCNNKDLMKIVAQNFKTDRVENISEDSLRNKYYNVEKITTEKMKDVVHGLLNLMRKY